MTIQQESYQGTKDWIAAFCSPWVKKSGFTRVEIPGCHKDGRTLARIEHDPHDDPDPITQSEIDAVMAVATLHDQEHPEHLIRVIHYYRSQNG